MKTKIAIGCCHGLAVLLLSGCVQLHPKAGTILTIGPPDGSSTFQLGFADAVFSPDARIVARGWHPREHETYLMVFSEPLPDFQPRWLLVQPASSTPPEYRVDLWMERRLLNRSQPAATPFVHFSGICGLPGLPQQPIEQREVSLNLRGLTLTNTAARTSSLVLSGTITARLVSTNEVLQRIHALKDEVGGSPSSAPETR